MRKKLTKFPKRKNPIETEWSREREPLKLK